MPALPLRFFDDCTAEPAKPWAIKGVLALGEDSSWYGPPGSLKSAFLTDIAVHLAAGRDWRGFKTKMRLGTVYFAFERAALTRRRLAAYAARDGHRNLPVTVADQIIDLIDAGCVEIIVETIKAAEQRFGIPAGLMVIDTFSKGVAAGGGDEDKAQHVNIVAANLKRVHEKLGEKLGHMIHIATIGHSGKDPAKGERGSSAKLGHIDVAVQISGEGRVKTATVVKGNDQPEDVLTSFEGVDVITGADEDGDILKAFILSPTIVPAPPKGSARLSDREVLALDALRRLRKPVAVDDWRDELFRVGVLDRDAPNPRQPFRRLRDKLARLQRIAEQDGLVRLTSTNGIPSIVPAGGNDLPLPPCPVKQPVTPSHPYRVV